MSNKVDQRIVEMRFDNSQFEKGVAQSINSLNNLKKSLNFDNTIPKSSIDSLTSNLNGLGSSVDTIADKFSTMGVMATTWVAKIANGIGDLAGRALQNLTKNITAGYNRYNEMMSSIQTIMYGTRDQWDDTGAQMDYVTAQIDKLNWYTDETSYNLSDMTNSIGKFVAAGVPLEDATSAMEGIASWAAISGQNAQKASMAMYNLSQAIAMGTLKSQDWRSIENANMATFEFKKTAIDLAQEMGKLGTTEEGWAYVTTKTGKEILVSYEGMRNTLSEGWFDKELLTAVLKRYGDFADGLYEAVNDTGATTTEFLKILDEYEQGIEAGMDPSVLVDSLARKNHIDNVTALGEHLELLSSDYYSLGKAAFKAAQESKTFTDSLNYTEDALTTTWMNIFQNIFGNYLESKELWTNVSELMYEQMVAPVEELEEQLSAWNGMGGADYLKDSFWNFYETFAAIVKGVKEGWNEIFPNNLGRQLLYIMQDIHKISEEFHFGDVGFQFKNIKDAAESLAHVFHDIKINFDIIASSAKKAWQRIFPKEDEGGLSFTSKITNNIRKVCEWLEELSSKFRLTDDDSKKLERTFAGLFAILDIGRLLLMAIIEPFLNINTEIGDVSHGILDVTASIGDWLVSLRDFIRDNEIFKKAISWLTVAFSKLPGYIDKVSRAFLGMGVDELFKKISSTATTLFMILGGLFVDFEGTIAKVDEFLTQSEFGNFWTNLKTNVNNAWGVITRFFGSITSSGDLIKGNIGSFFSGIWEDLKELFGFANKEGEKSNTGIAGFVSSVWEKLKGFFEKVKDKAQEMWATISGKASSVWDSIKGSFGVIGEKADALWQSIKTGSSDVKTKLEEFWGTVKNKASEIWGMVKSKVEEIWGKVVNVYKDAKAKVSEIWEQVRPHVILIGGAFVEIWNQLKKHGAEIWDLIGRVVDWLIEKGGQAIDWITNIDWKQWWDDLKKWCSDTWDSIKQFFDDLPGKADEAFQKLTGVDFETFLSNITDQWDKLKTKVEECWDTIKTFFGEELPKKMDEFAGKFGYGTFTEMFDDISTKVGTAYDKIMMFFGLKQPDWMTDGMENTKFEGDNLPEGYDVKYKNGFAYWKDFIPDFKDFTDGLEDLKSNNFVQQAQIILGIAAVLGAVFLVWKIIESANNLTKSISKVSLKDLLWGGQTNQWASIADNIDDVTSNIGKLEKGAAWSLMAGVAVQIAGSLYVVSRIPWPQLLMGVGSLGLLILELGGLLILMDKSGVNPRSALAFGEAFALMGGVFLQIGVALWLMEDLDPAQYILYPKILSALFGELIAAILVIDKYGGNPNSILKFATAVGALSGAMFVIASALVLMGDLDPLQLLFATLALGALFAEIVGLLILVGKSQNFDVNNVLLFAASVVALSGAMIVIASALMILDGVDPLGMLASTIAIGLLFAELAAVMALVSLMSGSINPAAILAFALSVIALSAAMIMIAGALLMLATIPADELMTYVIALGAMLVVMAALLVIAGMLPQLAAGMLLFATAVLLLGTGAMMAGLGMLLMAQGIETLAGVGPDGINAIIDGLIRLAAVAPLLALGFGAAIVIIATALGVAIVGFFTALAGSISENKEVLTQGLTDFWLIFVESFINVLPKVQEALNMLFDLLIDITPRFFEWVNEIIEGVTSTVFTAIGAFLDGLWDLFVRRLEWWRDNIGSIVHIIGETVENFLLAFFDEIETRVPRIVDAGMDMFINLCNGISDAVDKHAQDMSDAIHRVINSFKNLFCTLLGIDPNNSNSSSSVFSTFGGNIMQGLIDGIQGMIEDVKSTISWVADALKGTFTKDTEINSPSKVFMGYGKYIDEGLAVGLVDNISTVTDATEDVADASIESMSSALSGLSDVIDSEMDADPTIRPVLDLTNVTEGLGTMDEMLSAQRSVALAGYDSTLMNESLASQPTLASMLSDLKATISGNRSNGGLTTQNNTFNISGDDPKAIADEVSNILANQIERKGAVWA